MAKAAYDTIPVGIDWTPEASYADAFEQEYIRIQTHGGPILRSMSKVTTNLNYSHPNYNIIQSPGEKIYFLRHGHLLEVD